MKILSRTLSFILHPLLMPTYGTLLALYFSYLILYPQGLKLFLLLIVFLFTCLIPLSCILLLYAFKVIKTPSVRDREDRLLPFAATAVSYIAAALLLHKLSVPMWVQGFIYGGVLSLVVTALINLKWKISAHLTGIGGLIAAAFFINDKFGFIPLNYILGIILLSGILASARIYLGRHTLAQVLAGTASGILCISILMNLMF